jgi:lipoprotein-anchoring transpeptidase ErfK/SrfK
VADYFTLLSRAVASLDRNTKAAREALYGRARGVLVDQLRAAEPPLSDVQIDAEVASLDSAIQQVESEVSRVPEPGSRGAREPGARVQARPRRKQVEPAEFVDTAVGSDTVQVPDGERRLFSPAIISVLAAVVLAIIAAAAYAYLSRPVAKPLAKIARNAGDAPNIPNPSRPGVNKKSAGAKKGKAADTKVESLPYVLRRQLVYYRSTYPPGTLIVVKSQHMLYQVRAETVALRYSIAIGPKCLDAAGLHRVLGKDTSPVWPPANGGEHHPDSRLGARILYLSDLEYGIHGTDKLNAIGQNSAFGCFLLADDDITDLFDRTPVDTRVVIIN